jgi:hypothetical protein
MQCAQLYLAPSVKQLLAPTAAALERLADAGACIYLSYSAGDTGWHRTVARESLAAGGDLATLDGEEPAEGVTPGPFGINVMRVTGSGATDAGRGSAGA